MDYIAGQSRDHDDDHKVTHLYAGDFSNPGWPMCARGWNRDEGQSYSIWRGNISDGGICAICQRRVNAGLPPVPYKGYRVNPEFIVDGRKRIILRPNIRIDTEDQFEAYYKGYLIVCWYMAADVETLAVLPSKEWPEPYVAYCSAADGCHIVNGSVAESLEAAIIICIQNILL